jgi:hypothetical protein
MAGSCESDAETGWDQTQNPVEDLGERRRMLLDPIDVEKQEHLAVVRG